MKKRVKCAYVMVRVTEAQKDALTAAAAPTGLGVSSWLRMVGLKEAAALAGSTPITLTERTRR